VRRTFSFFRLGQRRKYRLSRLLIFLIMPPSLHVLEPKPRSCRVLSISDTSKSNGYAGFGFAKKLQRIWGEKSNFSTTQQRHSFWQYSRSGGRSEGLVVGEAGCCLNVNCSSDLP
jgi:hypothetical protein